MTWNVGAMEADRLGDGPHQWEIVTELGSGLVIDFAHAAEPRLRSGRAWSGNEAQRCSSTWWSSSIRVRHGRA